MLLGLKQFIRTTTLMLLVAFLCSFATSNASNSRDFAPHSAVSELEEPKVELDLYLVVEIRTYLVLVKTKDVCGRVFHHLDKPFQIYAVDHFYYGYRWYDASKGRWINRDPIKEDGGINVYNFCSGDPINWIDKLGLSKYPPYKKRPRRDPSKYTIDQKAEMLRSLVIYDKEGKAVNPFNPNVEKWKKCGKHRTYDRFFELLLNRPNALLTELDQKGYDIYARNGKLYDHAEPISARGKAFVKLFKIYAIVVTVPATTAKLAQCAYVGGARLYGWLLTSGGSYNAIEGTTTAIELATGYDGPPLIPGWGDGVRVVSQNTDEIVEFFAEMSAKYGDEACDGSKFADDVIHVTPDGIALPPGDKYKIPEGYIENPYGRPGSYGEMIDGKFRKN